MKVIDLLNKIAKGEDVPKKIKFKGIIYDYYKDEYFVNYKPDYGDWLLNQYLWKLNDEVEIIEEEKEIEKLNLDTDELRGKEIVRSIDYLLEGKINELIDVINDMRDKE